MSLSSSSSAVSSGMFAAQTGLDTVSDNVANLNTPGYVEKVIDLRLAGCAGRRLGRAGDRRRSWRPTSSCKTPACRRPPRAGQAGVISNMLSQAQGLFGDPDSSTGYFNLLNQVSPDFQAAANDPASSLSGIQVVNDVNQFLGQSQTISRVADPARRPSRHARSAATSPRPTSCSRQIAALNENIATRHRHRAPTPTNSQEAQNELINQLSSLMDIRPSQHQPAGSLLTTAERARSWSGKAARRRSAIRAFDDGGRPAARSPGRAAATAHQLATGVAARCRASSRCATPSCRRSQDQLSEYVTQAVNALNQAHNAVLGRPAAGRRSPVRTSARTWRLRSAASAATTNIAIVNSRPASYRRRSRSTSPPGR